MAEVAEPRNRVLPSIQPQSARIGERPNLEEASTAMKITPDTYSGVAVVAMEKVDSDRSSFDPSRIPASTPTISAEGTISNNTHSISLPVSASRVSDGAPTSSLKTVETPNRPARRRSGWRVPLGVPRQNSGQMSCHPLFR